MKEQKEKRQFYNVGEAKGYTRRSFYEDVQAMLEGEELTDEAKELMAKAIEYELEGLDLKLANRKKTVKDPMDSEYAKAIINDIIPLLDSEIAYTTAELCQMATDEGLFSPTGKPYAQPWVSRVLRHPSMVNQVKIVSKIVEKTGKNGLKAEHEITGYLRA